ncbi:MAG: translation elongation factor 4 [Candidatus Pacebacteria bacterium]|nr:translation elongation factor 4 [Candidatus Paceibacterota bacterium]
MNSIRNFSIIAHIDHGKSTLADRMLEVTKTIEVRKMREQVLDAMDLERERGITIKMQPVRMHWRAKDTAFVLNLIDTPGHIDFGYEVSRALTAVEGVLLLVDATQGVQAQTLAVLHMAREAGCVVIPVITKIDSPLARRDDIAVEMVELLGVELDDIIDVSGRTGVGVPHLLDAIVERIPAPTPRGGTGARALVFDYAFSEHRGIVAYVRMMDGVLQPKERARLIGARADCTILELGHVVPQEVKSTSLDTGDIGYVVTGLREASQGIVGDTLAQGTIDALPGYESPRPVVWASLYPETQEDFTVLKHALFRLKLSDSALSFEEDGSLTLGKGFRCGFLGMLHMEIVTERLKREHSVDPVITAPSITYEVTTKKETFKAHSASQFPNDGSIESVKEQWVVLTLMTPVEYLSPLTQLLYEHEGSIVGTEMYHARMRLTVHMPLRELMHGFFDSLKSATSGYASLAYDMLDWRDADVVRLDVLVAEEEVPALSRIISKRRLEGESRSLVERLKKELRRQMFVVKIQAKADGRIVASESISAFKKDVTGYLYGGDVTRKMKLLEKQKKGKERRGELGGNRMHIPQEVFLKMIKPSDD